MNKVKQAFAAGRPCIGSWIQTGNPVAAEILAAAGFDWIGIDCEHSSITVDGMSDLMRAIGDRAVPLVRVQTNAPLDIRRALDMGAGGVIVPMIQSGAEARAAVAAAKYPPDGVRGFGYCRANEWGERFDDYAASANRDTAVIAMIETAAGVEHAEEIVSADGVDGVFIGPYDLSGSLGVTGQVGHPSVVAACERVAAVCRRYGKVAGQHIVRPDRAQVDRALQSGFGLLALGADIVFLANGAFAARSLVDKKI